MKNSDVPRMALRRAVQICNGVEAVGDALNVSTDTLQKMLTGEEKPSHELFTQIVGLLLEATATRTPKHKPDSNEGGRKGPRH